MSLFDLKGTKEIPHGAPFYFGLKTPRPNSLEQASF